MSYDLVTDLLGAKTNEEEAFQKKCPLAAIYMVRRQSYKINLAKSQAWIYFLKKPRKKKNSKIPLGASTPTSPKRPVFSLRTSDRQGCDVVTRQMENDLRHLRHLYRPQSRSPIANAGFASEGALLRLVPFGWCAVNLPKIFETFKNPFKSLKPHHRNSFNKTTKSSNSL